MCKMFKGLWAALKKCDACACFLIAVLLLFSLLLLGLGMEPLKEFFAGALRVKADNAGGWIYEYQTLISGLFVLITIGISVWTYSSSQRERRRTALAKLPAALAGVADYASSCYATVEQRGDVIPDKPIAEMIDIQNAAGSVGNDLHIKLQRLCVFYQVHNSRLLGFLQRQKAINEQPAKQHMYESTQLYAICMQALSMAREDKNFAEGLGISQSEMKRAHRGIVSHRDEGVDDEVEKLITEKHE